MVYALIALLTVRAVENMVSGQAPHAGVVAADEKAPKPEEFLWKFLLGSGYLGCAFLGYALFRKLSELAGNPLKSQLAEYMRDPKYETRTAFLDSFHADFKRLTKTYAEGCRVYVFVDDLDRCEIPKAAELMQSINLLLSESTPVFYILGLDRQKVAAGLAAKYEKLLPYLPGAGTTANAGVAFGYTFLEKFIQVPFFLPQPTDRDIDRLLDSLNKSDGKAAEDPKRNSPRIAAGLLVKLGADSEEVRAVVKMAAPALDHNPRRIKQFINLFRLRALLASQTGLFGPAADPDVYDPLTFGQSGKLVAIALRWPLVFDALQSDSRLLENLQKVAWSTDREMKPWTDDRGLMALIATRGLPSTTPRDLIWAA